MISRDRIEATDRLLGDFFTARKASKFIIPDYQRRFVWKTKQLIDFVDSIYQNENGYFIGTIVVVGPDTHTYNVSILDGQQRLSSIFFILKIVRDKLKHIEGIDASLIEDINSVLFWNEIKRDNIRLHFNDKFTQNCFSFLMMDENPTDDKNTIEFIKQVEANTKNSTAYEKAASKKSISNLISTYNDVLEFLSNLSNYEITNLVEKIFSLQIIELICKNERIVNSLFEGLNSKGIKLTNSELIKNKLYEKAHDKSNENKVKENWESLDSMFYGASREGLIDKFLRHFYIARHGYIQGGDLYDSYVKEINDEETSLEGFTARLLRYGGYYLAIQNQKLDPQIHPMKIHLSVYDNFNFFGALDNDQIYEVLLRLLLIIDESNDAISTKEINIILKKLWAFCFRSKFLPISPSKYERKFASYCNKTQEWIDQNAHLFHETVKYIDTELAPLVEGAILRDQLVATINEDLDYRQRNIKLLTKVFTDLLSLEHRVEYKEPTIEHIVPQSSESKWGLKRSQVEDFVHKIGNLTLLDKTENNISENDIFTNKLKSCYSKNAFSFNKNLANLEKEFTSGHIPTLSKTISMRGSEISLGLTELYKVSG